MPDPLSDVVGGIVTDFIGSLFGGGSEKRYSAGDKRKILLETAARYGTESPQYQDLAKRWPKQARKVSRYELPTGAPAVPTAAPASQPLQPIIFTSVERGRGYPTGRPPTVDELMTGANIALAVTSAYGALTSLGRGLLAALFKRRAKQELGKIVARVGAARSKAAAKGLTGKTLEYETEKILAAEAKIAKIPKVGPVAVKTATKTAAKVSRSSVKQNIVGGTAAGTAAAIVQEIIARAKGGSQLPEKAPASPGKPGGASAPSGASSVGQVPTGSQVTGTPAAPGQSQGDTRVAPSSSEKAAAARSATREAAEKAKRNAKAFVAPEIPQWLDILLDSVKQIGTPTKSSRSGRGPMSEPEAPELPQPAPGGAPLTGFGPGGVGSCDCKPKRRSGKRKKRTVCYTGRFTETATGTLKYEKRRRTTCQPSRKKPASQRAR